MLHSLLILLLINRPVLFIPPIYSAGAYSRVVLLTCFCSIVQCCPTCLSMSYNEVQRHNSRVPTTEVHNSTESSSSYAFVIPGNCQYHKSIVRTEHLASSLRLKLQIPKDAYGTKCMYFCFTPHEIYNYSFLV